MKPRIRSRHDQKETLADHLAAGFLSALAMTLTVGAGVVFAFLFGHEVAEETMHAFPMAALILVGIAFIAGLVIGARGVADLYGAFWGTDDDSPTLTLITRIVVGVVIALTVIYV